MKGMNLLLMSGAVLLSPVVAVVAVLGNSGTSVLSVASCDSFLTQASGGGAVDAPIMGVPSQRSTAQVGRLIANRYRADPDEVELAVSTYKSIGDSEGVRWDWAIAQATLETGGFKSNGWVRDRNPAGIGHYDGQEAGFFYDEPERGVRAHIQLLKRYSEGNEVVMKLADSGVTSPVAGTVRSWGGLQGTWATSETYAKDLLDVYNSLWPDQQHENSETANDIAEMLELHDKGTLDLTSVGIQEMSMEWWTENCEFLAPPLNPTQDPAEATGSIVDVGSGIALDASIAGKARAMISAAAADGVTLSGSGWRSSARQIELRIAHGCGGALIYSRSCRGTPLTAVPGRSRHEKGLAIDFSNCSSRGTACFRWLAVNAERFGFYNLPQEPWHWSVDGG